MYFVPKWIDARQILENIETGAGNHALSIERHSDGSAYVRHIRLGVRIMVESWL